MNLYTDEVFFEIEGVEFYCLYAYVLNSQRHDYDMPDDDLYSIEKLKVYDVESRKDATDIIMTYWSETVYEIIDVEITKQFD